MTCRRHLVLGVREDRDAVPWAREGYRQHIANRGFGAVGHQDEPICQVESLIDIVRDQHDSGLGFLPHAK